MSTHTACFAWSLHRTSRHDCHASQLGTFGGRRAGARHVEDTIRAVTHRLRAIRIPVR
jgi:hypothetical protein